MKTHLGVVRRYLTRQWQLTLTLALTAVVVTLTLLSTAAVTKHIESSLDDSIRLSQGGASYAVKTSEPAQTQWLRKAEFAPVKDSLALRITGAASAKLVPLRHILDRGTSGRLVDGRLPQQSGEVVLTPLLKEQLGVALGDHIRIDDRTRVKTASVVGIAVDPMDPRGLRATVRVDSLRDGPDLLWLGDIDPRQAQGASQSNGMSVASIPEAFGDNNANPVSSALANARAALWLVALAGCSVAIVLLASLRQRAKRDVEALVATGFTRKRAWTVLRASWGAALLAGVVMGAAVAGIQQLVTNGILDSAFGQHWHGVILSSRHVLMAFVAVVVVPLIVSGRLPDPTAVDRVLRCERMRGRRILRLLSIACMATGILGVAVIAFPLAAGHPSPVAPPLAPLFGFLILMGIPTMQRLLIAGKSGPVVRKTFDVLTRPAQRASVIAAVVLFTGTTWAVMVDRIATDNSIDVYAGAPLQVVDVPQNQSEDLLRVFVMHGGRQGHDYAMLQRESENEPLATSPHTASCITNASTLDHKVNCLTNDVSPTTIVLSSETPHKILATTAVGASDQIGIVSVDHDGVPRRSILVSDVTAQSPEANAASVVIVGNQTPAAREPGLRPGNTRFVTLPGYFDLPTAAQASLRTFLYTSMPTAFPQSSVPEGEEVLRALAITIGIGGGLLTVLILALITTAQRRSTEDTRSIVSQLSTTTTSRPLRRSTWLPACTVGIIVPPLAALCSWCALPHNGAGVGFLWAVPTLFFLILAAMQRTSADKQAPTS